MNQTASVGIVVAAGSLPNVLAGNFLLAAGKLAPPAKGKIPVAFAISDGVTVIDFAGAAEIGANAVGSDHPDPRPILVELAELVATGDLDVPIAATYPLDRIADAHRESESGHTSGKIVVTL